MGSLLLAFALPAFLEVAVAQPARVLRLNDAVAAALHDHPSVKLAAAQADAAEAQADQAKSSFFPQLTGVASYQRVRRANFAGTAILTGAGTGAGAGGTGTSITPSNPATTPGSATSTPPSAITSVTSPGGTSVFTVGASVSQLIWDFGKTYDGHRSALRNAGAAHAQETVTAQQVAAAARRAYFTARAQKALVGVADESLANLGRHLGQIQQFVAVGTRPEIDRVQAETDVANGRVSLIDAHNAYELAKAQLAQAIGDASGEDFEVVDDELAPIDAEDLPPDVLYAKAIANRPELLMLERRLDSQSLAVRSMRGGYYPSLSANGGASETGTSLDGLGPAWNVGVALTWQAFQGGLTRGQVREAEANVAAAVANLDTQRLQIRVDVRQAAQNLRSAKEAQSAADEAAVNARERLRLAEGRYTSGLGNAIELGDSQLALTTALSQVVQARFRLSSSRADLLVALGRR